MYHNHAWEGSSRVSGHRATQSHPSDLSCICDWIFTVHNWLCRGVNQVVTSRPRICLVSRRRLSRWWWGYENCWMASLATLMWIGAMWSAGSAIVCHLQVKGQSFNVSQKKFVCIKIYLQCATVKIGPNFELSASCRRTLLKSRFFDMLLCVVDSTCTLTVNM